jgi:hypothetical protein
VVGHGCDCFGIVGKISQQERQRITILEELAKIYQLIARYYFEKSRQFWGGGGNYFIGEHQQIKNMEEEGRRLNLHIFTVCILLCAMHGIFTVSINTTIL